MITIGDQKVDEIYIGENAIRTVYEGDIECWSAARPITERSVGDILRYGNNTYVILDFNHARYPSNTVQILTQQTVNVTYNGGSDVYEDPALMSLFLPKLQNILVPTDFQYGYETRWNDYETGIDKKLHLDSATAKVNIPSLYEIGKTYSPQQSGLSMSNRYIDGVAFDGFPSLNIGTTWALRSYDYSETVFREEGVAQRSQEVMQISATGNIQRSTIYTVVSYEPVPEEPEEWDPRYPKYVTAAARVIASLPITTQVSAKPDENGIYDIKLS
ncbi:hypothetical protein [Ligaoa zhengdingensis]|uniref:hypothetical protein n=1 Tax=Ligaoa zhengdingensis TaxID=2763658 RepID=UPI0031BBA131